MEYDHAVQGTTPRWPVSRRLWISGIFLAVALFDASQTVLSMRSEGMHHNWNQLFLFTLLSWLPWALATPLIARLGRHYPPVQLRPVKTWVVHLVACGAIGIVGSSWNAFLENSLNPWAKSPEALPFLALLARYLYGGPLLFLILYATILTISYVFHSHERLATQQAETARLNEQLSKAQLDALRRQIEPHFLFNTLNAIAGLIREQKSDDAVSMIAGLSDLLRRVLNDSSKQQVPLRDEIEFLQKYLLIQKTRFAERLQVSMNVPPDLLNAEVPSLILQPFVENAIKHGIAQRAQGGTVRISAARRNGMLNLSVYNDGPRVPTESQQSPAGIGIANARTRLRALYGTAFDLQINNLDSSGVEVCISVPFKEE